MAAVKANLNYPSLIHSLIADFNFIEIHLSDAFVPHTPSVYLVFVMQYYIHKCCNNILMLINLHLCLL